MAKLVRRKPGSNPAVDSIDKIAITFLTGVYEALFNGDTALSSKSVRAAYSFLHILDQFPELVQSSGVGFRLVDLPTSGKEAELFEYGEYIVRSVYHGSADVVDTLTWRELTFIEEVSIKYGQTLAAAFNERLELFRGTSALVGLESEEGDIEI